MSIAAISKSFVATVSGALAVEPTEPVRARHRHDTHEPRGRRHELVDAMSNALGLGSETTRAQSQAVFRFAQTLMHDLRELDGGGEHEQHGHALGRRDWSDMAQRLTALAAAARRPGAAAPTDVPTDAPMPTSTEATTPTPIPTDAAAPVEAATPDIPETPSPVTLATVAVHIMRVPSSHLLEAFVALQRALGQQQSDADARSGLATLVTRLAEALKPDTKAELPAGSVLHVTA